MINNNKLIPKRAIFNVLGCLCENPKILGEKMELKVGDFEDSLYKIIFGAIENITIKTPTISKITVVDIDNYLSNYIKLYKQYEELQGFEFMSTAVEKCNIELFEKDYHIIKKFTLLRDFNNAGFDIQDIYNPETLDMAYLNEQAQKLIDMEIQDIVDYFSLKLINLTNSWNIEGNYKSYRVEEGLDTLLEDLLKSPDYGHPFLNKMYNTVFRGMRFGKLMIKSAGTGVGKTRTALTDIVSISCPKIYNMQTGEFDVNPITYSSSFISTELQLQELQTCLIAIISGVDEGIIKKGNYSEEHYFRIKVAIDILKESQISLHYINDFSIADIERIIEKDILEKDAKFIFFDYLQMTPKLSRTTLEQYGMGLREDQIMLNFASRLKNIAERYNVYISTATQLNRNSKDRDMRDATAIRGGSSQIDKADFAIQLYRTTPKDLEMVKDLYASTGLEPNFMHIVYKNRSGENDLIIWTKMNSGNMREEVCFVTRPDGTPMGEMQETDLRIG